MINTLKPYAEYKESGLPWLGDIPKHWITERAKCLFQKMEHQVRPDDGVVTCFRDGVVTLRKNRRVRGFTESLKEIGYQGVRKGDLVIHAMDAFAGAIGVSDSDGKCTPVYAICQPKRDVNTHYYAYIVREMARTQWIVALATGIRERSTDFRFAGFASQVVPIPPKEEQDAIACFVETQDRRINHLIHTKRRLIELLNEQKQAIIHQAVTRGLDPNVRLKPSDVECGDVPEHWGAAAVRRYCRVFAGATPSRAIPEYWKSGTIPWLASGDVNLRRITAAKQFITEAGFAASSTNWIRPGSVVIALAGQGRTKGMVATVESRMTCNQSLAVMEPSPIKLDYCFLAYYLESRYRDIRALVGDGLRDGLNLEHVRAIPIPLPPLSEQTAIVSFLDETIVEITDTKERVEHEIDLLREYRTRLISDVVTGKLDVRGVELPVMDETETLEDIDIDEDTEAEELIENEEDANDD